MNRYFTLAALFIFDSLVFKSNNIMYQCDTNDLNQLNNLSLIVSRKHRKQKLTTASENDANKNNGSC